MKLIYLKNRMKVRIVRVYLVKGQSGSGCGQKLATVDTEVDCKYICYILSVKGGFCLVLSRGTI